MNCIDCNVELIIDINWTEYRKNNSVYRCKDCSSKIDKYYRNNLSFEQKLRRKIQTTLYNHRYNGIEVIGSVKEYIHTYNGHCAYCNVEFDIFGGSELSGSLDRIHNDIYMSPDNVQWLCKKCNQTKSDRSHDEFMEFINMMYNKFNKEVI